MFTVFVPKQIEAAHQLEDSDLLVTKECARPHGHSYQIKVTAHMKELDKAGMTVDFAVIKNQVDKYDHRNLNDYFSPTTAENFAKVLHSEIKEAIKQHSGSELGYLHVEVSETGKSWVGYEDIRIGAV